MNEPAFDKTTAGVRPPEGYENTPEKTAREPRQYTRMERIAAWLLIPLGYGFCRACPVYRYPLGAMLSIFALLALTIFMLHHNGRKIRGMALAACISILPVSLSLFFSANAMIHTIAVLYSLAACAYTVYAACGNTLEDGLSDLLPVDLLETVFALPFAGFGALFQALGAGNALKKSGRVLLRIYCGLMLALVPTLLVVSLLSYDSHFRRSMVDLLSLDMGDLFSHLFSLLMGVLLALYFFGLYTSASENRFRERISAEKCRKTADRMHMFSPVTSCSAVFPLLVVYAVFFFSQWEQYVSAFTGDLPDSVRYADYAREGFFELCAVSFINLVLLTATGMFTCRCGSDGPGESEKLEGGRPETRRAHPAVRVLHILLSGCTLVLIATAVSKMFLYIEAYGLTPKRVYATWFMLVLAAVFVLVIIRQFAHRLKLIAVSITVCVGMFAALGLANVDGFIADYNVERYLNGTLKTLDTYTLTELGDAAVPAKLRAGLAPEPASEDAESIFSATLPGIRAELARRQTPETFD